MHDRGSATLLLPTGLLLMVVLGAIAVDLSHLYSARTSLQHRADAAANDAATAGLDRVALRSGHGYRLDARRVDEAAARAALVAPTGGLDELRVEASIVEPHTVHVEVEGAVTLLFAPALPGGPRRVKLRASAGAKVQIR